MKKNNNTIAPSNYSVSLIDLETVNINDEQEKKLEALNYVAAYNFANFVPKKNKIYFNQRVRVYEAFLNYLRAVASIVPTLEYNVEVTDCDDDNAYWIIVLHKGKIQECFGMVIWDTQEERKKVRDVLDAHLQTTDEKLNEIADQIIRALRGEFDEG